MRTERVELLRKRLNELEDKYNRAIDEYKSQLRTHYHEKDDPEPSETAARLMGTAADNLAKVMEAKRDLENGEYGHCSDCEGEISYTRLKALPFADRCINCQEGFELRYKVS
jgi:RNA polymerase-binding transcription factor DksA